MKRARKSSATRISQEIPSKQLKIATTIREPPPEYKKVVNIELKSSIRVTVNVSSRITTNMFMNNYVPKLLPDPKRKLIYLQNHFLDKIAVMNLKTGKIIKNLGPENYNRKRDVLRGSGNLTYPTFLYRSLHFLDNDTVIALRKGSNFRICYMVRIDLRNFKFEDLKWTTTLQELKYNVITDQCPVPELRAIAIAAELREILLIDPDKGIMRRYKHSNIIFGVSYYPKRRWIIGEARVKDPNFVVFDLDTRRKLHVVNLINPAGLSGLYGQNPSWLLDYLVMLINEPRLVKIHEGGSLEALDKVILEKTTGSRFVYNFCAEEQTQNVFCTGLTDCIKVYDKNFDLSGRFKVLGGTGCVSVTVISAPNLIAFYDYRKRTIGFCRVTYEKP